MAVVVNNTFLDVPAHKFLCFEEDICNERRCQSVPRAWKPVTSARKSTGRKRTPSLSSRCSVHSDLSFCSTADTLKDRHDLELELESVNSEIGSPYTHSSIDHDVTSRSDRNEVGSGYDEAHQNADDVAKVAATSSSNRCATWSHPSEANSSSTHISDAAVAGTWTKLKAEAPAFKPAIATADTRFDAVTYAVYLALSSSGAAHKVTMDKGVKGVSPSLVTAQLQSGSSATARCYEAVHLARHALEETTGRLGTTILLSKRVQKEDSGYSLRSSIACIPCGAENLVCWDLFKNGCCPRRNKCPWYHPQESDIGRVKVSIKCTDETKVGAVLTSSEDQLPAGSPAVRHKISLGDLVR